MIWVEDDAVGASARPLTVAFLEGSVFIIIDKNGEGAWSKRESIVNLYSVYLLLKAVSFNFLASAGRQERLKDSR
jgi:hypothetical protein